MSCCICYIWFHQTFHVHLHEATQTQLNSKEQCSKWHTCTMFPGNTLMGKMSPKGCLLSQANCIGSCSCMQLWCPSTSHLEKFGASKAKILWDVHKLWLPAVWVETNSSQARWKWCSTGELEPIFNGLRAKNHRSTANEEKRDSFIGCSCALSWVNSDGSLSWAVVAACALWQSHLVCNQYWKDVWKLLRDIWEIFESY